MPRHLLLSLALLAAGAGPGLAFDQEAVGPGSLPPIARDHGAQIAAWARRYYPDPRAVGPLEVSAPALMRDRTGRLLWLVCLDVANPPSPAVTGIPDRHAFGFAPGYLSAPHERYGATLVREDCEGRAVAWRPVRSFAALAGETREIRKRRRALASR